MEAKKTLTNNLVLRKGQQRRPTGGHHFSDDGLMLKDETFDGLLGKVRGLRIANGRPIGNPEREVLQFYAAHFPFMVEIGEGEPDDDQNPKYKKWRDWVRYVWYDPPKRLVTRNEAQLRWEKCLKCPRNIKKKFGDSEEANEFDRRAFMLRCGADIPTSLGFCTCHNADLGVFVYLDAPERLSNKAKDDKVPDECFLACGSQDAKVSA